MDPNGTNRGSGRGSRGNQRGGNSSKRFNPYQWRGGWNRNTTAGPRLKPTSFSIPAVANENNDTDNIVVIGPPANSQPLISVLIDAQPHKLTQWKLYFPQDAYRAGSSLDLKLQAMRDYIERHSDAFDLVKIRQTLCCTHSLQSFLDDALFMNKWPQFEHDLTECPEQTLNCAGLALHQQIPDTTNETPANSRQMPAQEKQLKICLQKVRLRLDGCGPCVNLRSLKGSSYGRLTTVRGTIIRAGAVQINITWIAFRCASCKAEQAIRQSDRSMTTPASCKDGCRARSAFIPLLTSAYTQSEAVQMIRLQESMQGAQFDSGRVPRSIEVEFSQDLVDSVCPGDDVTVTGVFKVQTQEDNQRKGVPSIYKMYVEAVSVTSNKNSKTARLSDFTGDELEAIGQIQKKPSPFRSLVHSLCPSIYGHEMVKAGLILGLFGGSGGGGSDTQQSCARRTEAHVLVVGDPGVGKSQMLQACANVSPRGIFVCGNSSTSAGLTVTVRHEKGHGGSLEAGALLLADQGACCIDEFDKMTANHSALLEVMEQQTVSVAKAGVLCYLPARTSVLAAANPVGGHYDRSRTVSENLKLNPALLSRFDLVFILLDRQDAHLDRLLTDHIQALQSGRKQTSSSSAMFTSSPSTQSAEPDLSLSYRLKLHAGERMDAFPTELMQKYIGFARKNVHPVLTDEAAAELKRFYLESRATRHGVDTIPVTTRQLEALIRLTQARARADLCKQATVAHAHDVLEIVRHSLVDVLSTDVGTLQMSRKVNGAGMSQSSQIKRFLKGLQQHVSMTNTTVFSMDELKTIAQSVQVNAIQMPQIVDAMNVQGFFLKKGQNLYKFMAD